MVDIYDEIPRNGFPWTIGNLEWLDQHQPMQMMSIHLKSQIHCVIIDLDEITKLRPPICNKLQCLMNSKMHRHWCIMVKLHYLDFRFRPSRMYKNDCFKRITHHGSKHVGSQTKSICLNNMIQYTLGKHSYKYLYWNEYIIEFIPTMHDR